ncbi:MAG: phosphate ABC transporter permease subunit PstC [Peptococcaceae bacterium]|nr:phosphate ABC transporter permease subunit PstC [Peptococcaceae bacterium]MEE0207238.1 phosphate ABC transporter permease subunit PstC [Peptococcaceae bacterium]
MQNNSQKQSGHTSAGLEKFMKGLFTVAACVSIVAVFIICIFMFANGLPAIMEIGPLNFLTGIEWRPNNDIYGILPMIVGSVLTTIGALIIGAPIGILSAVFLAFYCPKKIYPVLKSGVQLLAGIPSVVYGFFGLMVLVPFVREVFGGRGLSVLTASVLLGMMILPTIISVSESSIRAVNTSYYEGSVGLGATHERSIFRCVLPACKSGIMTGVVLGLGRAIGETMAVIMVAGNQAAIPKALTDGVRTMTTNIVMEMGYAVDLHRQALIGTAVVLFIFILIINFLLAILKRGDQQND